MRNIFILNLFLSIYMEMAYLIFFPKILFSSELDKQYFKWEIYKEWPFSKEDARYRQKKTAEAIIQPIEKKIPLGGGEYIELVLIPAGRFIMGTRETREPDIGRFNNNILLGQILSFLGFSLLVLGFYFFLFRKNFFRMKFFLNQLLIIFIFLNVLIAGVTIWLKERAEKFKYLEIYQKEKEILDKVVFLHDWFFSETIITHPFYIGKYEVTQRQFQAVMGYNPSNFKCSLCPVEEVSCDEARLFCEKSSMVSGLQFRLPTEAEWEYCNRGVKETEIGLLDSEEKRAKFSWYSQNSGNQPHPVGTREPNGFGVYDMEGNVSEICQDWWVEFPSYESRPRINPTGPENGTYRVVRGNSFRGHSDRRSTQRTCTSVDSDGKYPFIGFRIVVNAVSLGKGNTANWK